MRSRVFPIAGASPALEPDAHGQAALMLLESLLHTLLEKRVLTNVEGLQILDTACQLKVEIATADGESKGRIAESLDLLKRISASLDSDEL